MFGPRLIIPREMGISALYNFQKRMVAWKCNFVRSPPMKTVPIVRVFETPGGWHGGIRQGHYADEKTKTDAIRDATQLAQEVKEPRIGVYNLSGEIIETIHVEMHVEPLRRVVGVRSSHVRRGYLVG